jgi:hypothetical protein
MLATAFNHYYATTLNSSTGMKKNARQPWNYINTRVHTVRTKKNVCGVFILYVATLLALRMSVPDIVEEAALLDFVARVQRL